MQSASRNQRAGVAGPRAQDLPSVEIIVESPLWNAAHTAKAVLRKAIRQACAALSLQDGEVCVLLADDSVVRRLNHKWRGQDAPTNVLSFPAYIGRTSRGTPRLLGDIVIAYETTRREARMQRKSFVQHLAHLAVHGFLHLVGFDHETDRDAHAMERLEVLILSRLGVPNPYIACKGATEV